MTEAAKALLDRIAANVSKCEVCGKPQTGWSYCVISDGEHHEYESAPIVAVKR
jgi:hypothetical protein